MNFTVGNTNDPEFFLTENKTIGFLAEISSDVTVPKKTSAIQAWRKTGGGMTFNDVLPISAPEITLARSKSNIFYTTIWFFHFLFDFDWNAIFSGLPNRRIKSYFM